MPCVTIIYNYVLQDETRLVEHLQFTGWPDHGVPSNTLELIDFLNKVKVLSVNVPGPLLVHCRLGSTWVWCATRVDDGQDTSDHIDMYLFQGD